MIIFFALMILRSFVNVDIATLSGRLVRLILPLDLPLPLFLSDTA